MMLPSPDADAISLQPVQLPFLTGYNGLHFISPFGYPASGYQA